MVPETITGFDSPETADSDDESGQVSEAQFVALLGGHEFDRSVGLCQPGPHWCSEQLIIAPSDEHDNRFDRIVIGMIRGTMYLAVGVGTFVIRAGHMFRGGRHLAMIAYGNKLRTTVLRRR